MSAENDDTLKAHLVRIEALLEKILEALQPDARAPTAARTPHVPAPAPANRRPPPSTAKVRLDGNGRPVISAYKRLLENSGKEFQEKYASLWATLSYAQQMRFRDTFNLITAYLATKGIDDLREAARIDHLFEDIVAHIETKNVSKNTKTSYIFSLRSFFRQFPLAMQQEAPPAEPARRDEPPASKPSSAPAPQAITSFEPHPAVVSAPGTTKPPALPAFAAAATPAIRRAPHRSFSAPAAREIAIPRTPPARAAREITERRPIAPPPRPALVVPVDLDAPPPSMEERRRFGYLRLTRGGKITDFSMLALDADDEDKSRLVPTETQAQRLLTMIKWLATTKGDGAVTPRPYVNAKAKGNDPFIVKFGARGGAIQNDLIDIGVLHLVSEDKYAEGRPQFTPSFVACYNDKKKRAALVEWAESYERYHSAFWKWKLAQEHKSSAAAPGAAPA